ncbi:hypothetical protein [Janthinobacterium agaricidamnosum]|uniref:hypothetical protein n=1 Tax=Janthinobacterium agaricidamnosum TaxID=55508 RepID=UPI00142F381A|nr:hypothetical protein [Janthinobacterium agaricidamnosum]
MGAWSGPVESISTASYGRPARAIKRQVKRPESRARGPAPQLGGKFGRLHNKIRRLRHWIAPDPCAGHRNCPALAYNPGFDFTIEDQNIMEAERINSLSALLADLTTREAELRRYL